MLVARTDQDAPKHKGLTYFILDMDQDAVQVRPLVQITGEAEFNELFIEEARIPDENVVGGVGNGWKVALTTLMNERAGLGFFLQVRMRQLLDRVFDEAAATGALDDPRIADKLADLHLRTEILRLTAYRGLSVIEQYGQPGPEGSLVKLMWSETNKQLTQLAADIVGPEALAIEHAGSPDQQKRWLPGLASGELRGALGAADQLIPDAPGADVVVVVDAAAGSAHVADGVEAVEAIDLTRRHGRATSTGEQ